MTTDDLDARFEKVDRQIAELQTRLSRVEGELGIVDVDDAGIPSRGEIVRQQGPSAAPN